MTRFLPPLLVAVLLTACGGGDGAPPVAAPAPVASAPTPVPPLVGTAPASAPLPAPVVTAPEVSAPPPAPPGTGYGTDRLNVHGSGKAYPVHFSGVTELIVVGDLNTVWLTAVRAGGTATITGTSNTFVFGAGAVPASVIVTGAANIFYLPEGSPVKLEGTGAALSTINYYKPSAQAL